MDIPAVSKLLSYLLRHHPEKANLQLDRDGFVYVTDLLAGLADRRALVLSPSDLANIITYSEQEDKKRFEFNIDKTMIRAIQGHSVVLDIKYDVLNPIPEFLYHGTTERSTQGITTCGIQKMSRNHVHLSLDFESAWRVAKRRRFESPVVLKLSGPSIVKTGSELLIASNKVVLTKYVDPSCIMTMMTQSPLAEASETFK